MLAAWPSRDGCREASSGRIAGLGCRRSVECVLGLRRRRTGTGHWRAGRHRCRRRRRSCIAEWPASERSVSTQGAGASIARMLTRTRRHSCRRASRTVALDWPLDRGGRSCRVADPRRTRWISDHRTRCRYPAAGARAVGELWSGGCRPRRVRSSRRIMRRAPAGLLDNSALGNIGRGEGPRWPPSLGLADPPGRARRQDLRLVTESATSRAAARDRVEGQACVGLVQDDRRMLLGARVLGCPLADLGPWLCRAACVLNTRPGRQ